MGRNGNLVEWNFPSTNNGQIKGVADAGIETFQGDGIAGDKGALDFEEAESYEEPADVEDNQSEAYNVELM